MPRIDTEDQLIAELREQTKWLRFLGLRALGPVLETQLKDDRERLAYELSDGAASTRTIGDSVGVSARTISNWWQRWTAAGIAVTDDAGRATHLTSLRAVGLEVAPTPSKKPEQGA